MSSHAAAIPPQEPLFRTGGEPYDLLPRRISNYPSHWRRAAQEVAQYLCQMARANKLTMELTTQRIADAIGRSPSFVQKGLQALTGTGQAKDVCDPAIKRLRMEGRRIISFVRGLASREDRRKDRKTREASPPAPPEETAHPATAPARENQQRGEQSSTVPTAETTTTTPDPIPSDHPTILRGLALIPDATVERIAKAMVDYTEEWVRKALDKAEHQNRKRARAGAGPIREWFYVLRILEGWKHKEGGPPADPAPPPPAEDYATRRAREKAEAAAQAEADARKNERLRKAWGLLTTPQQDAIKAAVTAANPGARALPEKVFTILCLNELDRLQAEADPHPRE